MAKKIQLQDASGNVLHPLTLGECVTMSNGENLDTLMSKSQMFTPTITQDKSMFKVGTGVDVDYSANVKDGAYESLVFKGKSLVNLASEKTKSFTTSHFLRCTLSHELVNGKKYLLKWNITNNTIGAFDVRFLRTSDGVRSGAFTLNVPKVVTVTNDGFDAIEFFTNASSISQGLTATIDNIMVVEYVEGMENNISYFEGLCDVKMPILRNVGKNLFDVSTWKSDRNLQLINNGDGYTITGARGWFVIPVKVGEKYSLTYKGNNSANSDYALELYETNNSNSTPYGEWDLLAVNRFKTPNSVSEISSFTYIAKKKYLIAFHGSSERQLNLYDLQLEESSMATTYEDHKTNILRTSEEIVLREVGGVRDSYDALTGEYVQRIGEVVLDGSTRYNGITIPSTLNNTVRYDINIQGIVQGAVMNDKLPNNVFANRLLDEEMVLAYTNQIQVRLAKTKLSNLDVPSFLEYLQQNPIKIQYQLAQPITTIVKPSTMTPFAYQNGHVVVESGFEGQSLLPEIEYSVVTGRTGQVTQNTKVLRQQEQQIISLEELLLTQVVQMEYERTLLQFDYELQMMMLG